MGVISENKEDSRHQTAVIQITKALAHMEPKYYYQDVPYWKTKEDKIYIKKGSSGNKTISTDNIKVLKVFDTEDKESIEKYLKNLRNGKKDEEKESVGIYNESKTSEIIKNLRNRFKSEHEVRIDKFQKVVDKIFKYTTQRTPFDNVDSLKVGTVWKDCDKTKCKYWVRVYPTFTTQDVDENKFLSEYANFQKEFENIAKFMKLSDYFDFKEKDSPNHEIQVDYDFLEIRFRSPLPTKIKL